MRGFAIFTGGGIPDAPTIGTATAGNAGGTISFTPPAYIGKGTVTYEVTSTPGGLSGAGASSPISLGLTNGITYTFTVRAVTNYGVSSAESAASNAITPSAPLPPTPPTPPPCSCTTPGPTGSPCARVFPNTCDGQMTYEYYDCGCSQTCPGTGGYNGQYIIGSCGYTGPVNCGNCGDGGCAPNGCGGTICYDGCGNACSNSGCPPACPSCPGIGDCCPPATCSPFKDGYICI